MLEIAADIPLDAPETTDYSAVDTSRVEQWVLGYVNAAKVEAETVSEKHIWNRVDAENKAYGLRDTTLYPQDAGIKAASLDQTYEVHTKDLSDQVDEMTSLLMDLVGGVDLFRLSPKDGVSKQMADLTQKVQSTFLKEKDWDLELRKFVGRFVRNCVAGMRVCRTHEVTYITERVEVPVYAEIPTIDPLTGEPTVQRVGQYTDDALLQRGFTPQQLKDGSALRMVMAEQGLTFVGIADEREDGTYDNLLCTTCQETAQDYVFTRAINPRRIAIADPTRPFKDQPSVHEYSYLTANELRKARFLNVDVLKEKGVPINNTSQQNPGSIGDFSSTQGTLKVPVYEICESWIEIPFEQGVIDNKFSEEELRAFLIKNGVPETEVQHPSYKWAVHHNKDRVLLGIYTSYMADKSMHPFEGESFVFGDGEFSGNSQLERLSSVASNMLAILNMMVRGIKKNLYGSRIISDRLGLTDSQIKQLDQMGGTVQIEGGVQDLDAEIRVMQYPDQSQASFAVYRLFEDKLRGLGVPSILAGEGQADTATQDSINNRRGQTIVDEAFGRMMGVIIRVATQHLKVMVNTFTTSRYVQIVGEDGMTLTNRWTMPSEITDKLDVVPLVSFNDGEKQRMAQFLMGIMNIIAPLPQLPPNVKAVLQITMEKMGFDSIDIDRVIGADGSMTNVQQEIKAMLADPDLSPVVKMEDPHVVCIQMAQMTLAKEQQRYAEMGMPAPDFANIIEYIQTHEGLLEQQQLLAQMQQAMGGGLEQGQGELRGKPVQARADGGPGTEEGGARQVGQFVGAGNKGPMSSAGLTGQGSVGLVKGAPAGI